MTGWWRPILWLVITLPGWFLAVVFGIAAAGERIELDNRHFHIEWGNAAEWAAGIGTVLAFAATVYVFGYRTRERRLADRREQAGLITAWITPWVGEITPTYKVFREDRGGEFVTITRVNIINASPSVIYDLVAVVTCEHSDKPIPVFDPGTATSTMWQPPSTPWEPRRDRLARAQARALPPGRWKAAVELPSPSVRPKDLNLFFRDHRGVYWRRDPLGQLIEQAAPPQDKDGKGRLRQIEHELGEGPSDAPLRVLVLKPPTTDDDVA